MGWRKASFKGQEVWAEVNAAGALEVAGGRVGVRYSDKPGAKVYRAGASRVVLMSGAPIEAGPAQTSLPGVGSKKTGRGSGFGSAGRRTEAQAAQAAASAAAQIEALEREGEAAICFTDGGCKGNPGPAGSGAVVRLPDGRRAEASLSLGRATNNIAELTAIQIALELLDEAGLAPAAKVVLFSDSKYARGVLTQGWKAKANPELIAGLRAALSARPGVELRWVAGHVGVADNERADALAGEGVAGRSGRRWL